MRNIAAAIVLLSVVCVEHSYATVIGHDSKKQELFVTQQKINVVYQLLEEECPGYVNFKRELEADLTTQYHIEVAIKLYNKLIRKLVGCRTNSSNSAAPVYNTTTTAAALASSSTDCQTYYEKGHRSSGTYDMAFPQYSNLKFTAWCDFFDNHGWTVIQRRDSNTVSFERDWQAYKQGFGSVTSEHWLGNEHIHVLTRTNTKLNIGLRASDGTSRSGYWSKFVVADELNNYKLTIDSRGYNGTLADKFSPTHNGMMFSTSDQDNDETLSSCATTYKGGWWYKRCYEVDLNGEATTTYGGLLWRDYPLSGYLTSSVMRVTRD